MSLLWAIVILVVANALAIAALLWVRRGAEAELSAATVRTNIQRASNYVLGVVLFAVSLFFAGMSTRLTSPRLRLVTLTIGCAVFLGTAIWIATSPVSIAV